jgi:hypothetical protein
MNYDAATDPNHGNHTDETQHLEERWHTVDSNLANSAVNRPSALSKVHALRSDTSRHLRQGNNIVQKCQEPAGHISAPSLLD